MDKQRLDVNMQDGLRAAAEGTQSGNYLGDAKVVDQLVRDFMSVVFSERAKFHETGEGDGASARINQLCSSYGKVFMGESDAYVAQPWNSIHRLGNFLRAMPDVAFLMKDSEIDAPCEAYFHFLAVQALSAAIALEQGEQTEEQVKAGLTEVVHDAVDVLLGRKAGAA
ncbi:MAG: hypothetical protein ABFE07_00325 [Armatimonadia bacterium]